MSPKFFVSKQMSTLLSTPPFITQRQRAHVNVYSSNFLAVFLQLKKSTTWLFLSIQQSNNYNLTPQILYSWFPRAVELITSGMANGVGHVTMALLSKKRAQSDNLLLYYRVSGDVHAHVCASLNEKEVVRRYEGWYYTKLESYYILKLIGVVSAHSLVQP